MKKVFLSIVAGLTVLLLVGCGSKQTKEVEKTQASALTQKKDDPATFKRKENYEGNADYGSIR